jgi:predicted small secreted protein
MRTQSTCRDRRPLHRLTKSAIVAIGAAAALSLSACNTTAGVGKDVKAAGNGIENAAEAAK